MNKLLLSTAFIMMLSGCAANAQIAEGVPVQVRDTSLGKVLVSEDGMTLYTFGRDEPGKTNCYDQCAVNWPPYMASSMAQPAGDFSLVARNDGGQQWAYKGEPLYLWVADQQPGDVTGHNVGDVWFVVPMETSRSGSSSGGSGYGGY